MKVSVHLKTKETIEIEDFVSVKEHAPFENDRIYTAKDIAEMILQKGASYLFKSSAKQFLVDGTNIIYIETD